MKIIHLSDTHSKHRQVKWNFDPANADVIIASGDLSNIGEEKELRDFFKWFTELPVKYKIAIAGNHDKAFDPKFWHDGGLDSDTHKRWIVGCEDYSKKIIEEFTSNENHFFLNHESCEIEGVKFFGSPWSADFHSQYWAFNIPRGEESKKLYTQIPAGTNVLITHGPPFERLDITERGGYRVGCEELAARIKEIKPQAHLFGHIHEGYGHSFDGDTLYLNSSIMTIGYFPINKPQVFELKDGVATLL